MIVDWAHFTPGYSLAGGILIGLAAAIFILFNGKIAGISGLLGSLLRPTKKDIWPQAAFVVGLILAPIVFAFVGSLPSIQIDANGTMLIIAGLLVGVGTRLGSGCTSGHGVCGLSRCSMRSFVATLAFMMAGFVTVFIIRHLI